MPSRSIRSQFVYRNVQLSRFVLMIVICGRPMLTKYWNSVKAFLPQPTLRCLATISTNFNYCKFYSSTLRTISNLKRQFTKNISSKLLGLLYDTIKLCSRNPFQLLTVILASASITRPKIFLATWPQWDCQFHCVSYLK